MDFLDTIYRQIHYIGVQTMRYGKRFFNWLLSLLLKPVKAFGMFVFTIFIVVEKHFLKAFHSRTDEWKAIVEQTKRNPETADGKRGKKSSAKAQFKRYKSVVYYVGNLVLPVITLFILISVLSFWSNSAFALEVNYNDETIGYVQNEAVYKQAREMAYDRLDINTASVGLPQEEGKESKLIGDAEYKIRRVKRVQLNDASEICDKLIEKSDNKITNACGVYVEGNFICAVKNETDALSVFDSILAEHETGEENAVVSFVENIDYVQGLYLDSDKVIKDAEYLQNKLNSSKSENKYHVVEDGDTIFDIAQKNSVSVSRLYELNPELTETLQIGQKILVAKGVDFIRVQTTKTEYKEAEIPFETVTISTSSLYVCD